MAWTPWEKVAGFDFTEVIYEKKYHLELEGGVARITMNRPDQMNAFTSKMGAEVWDCYVDADKDPMVGVVVLTGTGDRVFSAGGFLPDYLKAAEGGTPIGGRPEERERRGGGGGAGNEGMRMCRKPSIARVNGYAIGHGHHLALQCDITIAAEHAIFGHNGPRISAASGGSYVSYLTFLIGAKRAREMNFLCRRYIAQEALEMGLVNKVVRFERLDEEVDKWCEDILRASPTCIEVRKRSFDTQWDLGLPMGAPEVRTPPGFGTSPEAKEGPAAFLEKRPANFWKLRKELGEAAYKKPE